MLVLSRKKGERIRINSEIELVVLETHRNNVRLGFLAPPEVTIHREEIHRRICAEQEADEAEASAVAVVGSR